MKFIAIFITTILFSFLHAEGLDYEIIPGEIYLKRNFDTPIRLVISIQGVGKIPRQAGIFIHGVNASGQHRVERIAQDQFHWQLQVCNVTSRQTYLQLEYI